MRVIVFGLLLWVCGMASAVEIAPVAASVLTPDGMRQLSTSAPHGLVDKVRAALDAGTYASDPAGEREALWWMGHAAINGSDAAALTETIGRLKSLAGVEHDTLAESYAGFLSADQRIAMGDAGGIDDALRAAALQQESPDRAHRALAQFQLCDAYSMASQPEHSQPLCRKADATFALLHDEWNRAQAENDEGNNALSMGHYEKARRFYDLARKRYVAVGDHSQVLMVGDNLAQVYLKEGKPAKAIVLSRAALADERKAGRQSDALISQYDIARALQALGKHDQAMQLIATTVDEAREGHFDALLPDLLEQQSRLAEHNGDLKLALSAERDALVVSRTHAEHNLSSQEAKLATRYAAREKEMRIEELERSDQVKNLKLKAAQVESARNDLQLRRQRITLIAVLTAAAGLVIGIVSLLLLVYSQRRHARALRRQALEDPLTGVDNRRGFFARAHALLNPRGNGKIPLHALLLFDFDYFKRINDQCGHAFGDIVLNVSLQRVRDVIGDRGHLARLGGEEFVALCPRMSGEAALILAEDMRAAIAGSAYPQAPDDLQVTISIGIALFDGVRCHDVGSWLRDADDAMYVAKSRGRDQVAVAHSVDRLLMRATRTQ